MAFSVIYDACVLYPALRTRSILADVSIMKKRLGAFFALLVAGIFLWSAHSWAHKYPSKNYVWPSYKPVWERIRCDAPMVPTQEFTLLQYPIRVDLDKEAPGRYGVRAIRLHLRGLHDEDETTVVFEESLFPSAEEMTRHHGQIASLMRAPILSMRFEGMLDPMSPRWNKRYKVLKLPYWIEEPYH
ncbi:MAG: hypothetical protein HY815_18235 [Candidatus Riflebacteria bacterium]|nr:hypothetical protein [Candidatus Riflebacteria bacterium]